MSQASLSTPSVRKGYEPEGRVARLASRCTWQTSYYGGLAWIGLVNR